MILVLTVALGDGQVFQVHVVNFDEVTIAIAAGHGRAGELGDLRRPERVDRGAVLFSGPSMMTSSPLATPSVTVTAPGTISLSSSTKAVAATGLEDRQ